jgi:hypothetical protein
MHATVGHRARDQVYLFLLSLDVLLGELKRKTWMEEASDWCCLKMAMNGENMAKSSSKILANSGM